MSAKTARACHTPGPWDTAYNDPFTVLRNTGDKTYRFVAMTDSRHDTGRQDDTRVGEDLANARLIAAAPDLLEAAKRMVSTCDQMSRAGVNLGRAVDLPYQEMTAAIAKASA